MGAGMIGATGERGELRPDVQATRPFVALGRCVLVLAAFVLAGVAYRDHFLVGPLPWWRWLVELAAGVTLLIVALAQGEALPESPWRRSLRWLAAAGTVGFGWIAIRQVPVHGAEFGAALAVVGALVLAVLARWRPMAPADVQRVLAGESPRRRERTLPGLGLGLAGVTLVGAAVVANESNHLVAFVLWVVGLGVFAGGMARISVASRAADVGFDPEVGPGLARGTEALLFLLVLAAGVGLRLFALGTVPTWIDSDEGRLAYWAAEMWKDGFPNVFAFGWNSFPNLTYMVHYAGAQVLGPSNTNLRLVSALVGVASLVPVYFWARRWWGVYVALVAMALLAMNQEHLYWSRVGFNNIDATLAAGLVLATFARALRSGRPVDWVWLGYALGAGFHVYHAAKLYPWLIVAALLPMVLAVRGALRIHGGGFAVAVVAMLLVIGPQFVSMMRQWPTFSVDTSNRNNVHRLVEAVSAGDVAEVRAHFYRQVVDCLYVFLSMPYKQPVLDAAVALPFLLGIGWMFWRWRDPRHLTVLAWIAGILVAGGMMTDYPPSKQRMVGFLPALGVVAAVVAGRLRGLLHQALGRRAHALVAVATVGWLGIALHGNWYTHFVFQAQRMQGDVMTNICRRILAADRPLSVYSIGARSVTNPRQIERDCTFPPDPQRFDVAPAADHGVVPLPPEHRGGAIITIPREQRELLPLVRAIYPKAKLEIVRGHEGDEDLYVLTLRSPDVEQMRGLIPTFRDAEGSLRIGGFPPAYPPPDSGFVLQPPPDAPPGADVRWRGHVWIPVRGPYQFRVSAGSAHIGAEFEEGSVDLVPGWHPIEVGTRAGDSRVQQIEWLPPDATDWRRIPRENLFAGSALPRLLGRYFGEILSSDSAEPLAAIPLHERVEVALGIEWGLHDDDAPPDWFARRPSTMEWVGQVYLAPGAGHAIRIDATTPTQVFVAGRRVLATEGVRHGPGVERALPDVSGWVPLLVRSVRAGDDDPSRWQLRLSWSTLGGDWAVLADYRLAPREPERLTPSPEDPSDLGDDLRRN